KSLFQGGVLARPAGTLQTLDDAALLDARLALAAGLGAGCDVSLALPYHYGFFPGLDDHMEDAGIGDLSLTARAGIPLHLPWLAFSVLARADAPTSSDDAGVIARELAYHPAGGRYRKSDEHPFGSSRFRAGGGAALTLDFTPWLPSGQAALHLNLEGARALSALAGNELGLVRLSMAAEGAPLAWLRFSAEL